MTWLDHTYKNHIILTLYFYSYIQKTLNWLNLKSYTSFVLRVKKTILYPTLVQIPKYHTTMPSHPINPAYKARVGGRWHTNRTRTLSLERVGGWWSIRPQINRILPRKGWQSPRLHQPKMNRNKQLIIMGRKFNG